MFKLIVGRSFELALECGGIYLRAGKRELYWSREQGLTVD